jgi:intracellular sulfur oxidation DsrE/DsrF family protein
MGQIARQGSENIVLAGRTLATAALALFVLGAVSRGAWAQSAPPLQVHNPERYRVVMQVSDDDPGKWNLVLNNARNIQAKLGQQNVDIEIVAYGPGLAMLLGQSKVGPRLSEALDHGIGLLACETTMQASQFTKDDLYDRVGTVSAGVVHIMQREREGWAYLRP